MLSRVTEAFKACYHSFQWITINLLIWNKWLVAFCGSLTLFFFFKGTIPSCIFLTPSGIFRLACEVPCFSYVAQKFLLPQPLTLQIRERKLLLATKPDAAVDWVWFIPHLKFGSSRKNSSRFATLPSPCPIPSQNAGKATALALPS